MTSPVFVDISGYQNYTVAYLTSLKHAGAKTAVVKLTEGTSYLNPRAAAQITNSLKVFGSVGVYHYFHGAGTAEAAYFLSHVKAMGLDTSTVVAIDVEDPSLPTYNTAQTNVFLKYLVAHGYKNVVTYASRSWFQAGRLVRSSLAYKPIWVAAYGTSQPGIDNANAWQFTDNYKGLHVDASYDFDGTFTGVAGKAPAAKAKSSYYRSTKLGLYEVTGLYVNIYKTSNFSKKTKSAMRYSKGTKVWARAVKAGSITHLKLEYANGYISSNSKLVKRVYLKGGD